MIKVMEIVCRVILLLKLKELNVLKMKVFYHKIPSVVSFKMECVLNVLKGSISDRMAFA